MNATRLNQPTTTMNTGFQMEREQEGFNAPRDTRSARDKWSDRNARSKERQRATRERLGRKTDNTGNRPIIDNGADGVPRQDITQAASGGGGGTGLPDGYGPEAYTICVDGAPVTRNFLTDNPD